MAASQQTFMASWPWRTKVGVGCLVYIAFIQVVKRMFPGIASWPWGVWFVLSWLTIIAFLTLWVIAYFIIIKYVSRRKPLELDTRSDKAKEKLADSLMSVGTAIHSATLVAVLVFPLTAVITLVARGTDPLPVDALATWLRVDTTLTGHGFVFMRWVNAHAFFLVLSVFAFFLPAVVGAGFRVRAMNIYDGIQRHAASPSLAPTPEPANDRPTVLSTPASDLYGR